MKGTNEDFCPRPRTVVDLNSKAVQKWGRGHATISLDFLCYDE